LLIQRWHVRVRGTVINGWRGSCVCEVLGKPVAPSCTGGSSHAQRVGGQQSCDSTPIVLTGRHSEHYGPEKQGEVGVIGDREVRVASELRHHHWGLCAAVRAPGPTSNQRDTDPERGTSR
jgi:hypothetical protein